MLDLGSLFEGVDFSQAAVGEDGIIRINKESNNDIADILESNLENLFSLTHKAHKGRG